MKTVDFHCHTKATKKHESELRTVTPELFAEMLDRAGVEIAAITNHNAFDLPQFQNLVSVTHDFDIRGLQFTQRRRVTAL